MVERLSGADVSFLYLEGPTTPLHVGSLLIITPPPGGRFDYDDLVDLIESRLALVPRYRQKVRTVPGRLAGPVWVDDPDFDITFHVRRSALPRPGSDDQLREFTARIMSRPLDRGRPLWEVYLVEGLGGDASGRVALLTKTHQAVVDGVEAIDLGTVILDASPDRRPAVVPAWVPEPEPSDLALLAGAAGELVRRPVRGLDVARRAGADLRAGAGRVVAAAGQVAGAVRVAARPAHASPLNVDIGAQRRYGVACTDLDVYRAVRARRGGTVNDVVLATVAGALRSWLLFRGEAVGPDATVRAMLPVSVRQQGGTAGGDPDGHGGAADGADGSGAGRVVSYLVDLPVGEGSALVRLSQVTYAMRAHQESGRSVGAESLIALGGFAPPTLHAMGARAAAGLTRRLFNLVVTNVPGPQFPLYAAGARVTDMFPIEPLVRGQAVAIGLTSYDGRVYYGLTADRDAMPDVDVLGSLLEESLAELAEAAEAAELLGSAGAEGAAPSEAAAPSEGAAPAEGAAGSPGAVRPVRAVRAVRSAGSGRGAGTAGSGSVPGGTRRAPRRTPGTGRAPGAPASTRPGATPGATPRPSEETP